MHSAGVKFKSPKSEKDRIDKVKLFLLERTLTPGEFQYLSENAKDDLVRQAASEIMREIYSLSHISDHELREKAHTTNNAVEFYIVQLILDERGRPEEGFGYSYY